ncbi:hypothetical protein [Flavobacterium sp.]|uniref:hypothetical protein n=1 Tax=Flavobacterium sp. TaxID=239 RepID=UPI0025F07971|nr:hypothetical protein [Flavobacterium sp.]
MKYLLNIIFLISFWNCFSQNNYPSEPKEYKKIHFVYEQKSNYYLNESGVYADTLLLSFNFPKLKYTIVKNPNEPNTICGFVPFSSFIDEDRTRIIGSLYHTYQIFEGTYDAKKKKTKIKVIRDNKEIRDEVKKYFNEYKFPRFTYGIVINYKKEKDDGIYTSYFNQQEKKEQKCVIVYEDERKLSGYFKKVMINSVDTYLVVTNKNLNDKITPAFFFTNSEFGIEKVNAFFSTYELKSVTYE